MKIAIEGCAHGELEKIYDTIELLEKKENIKVDLLLCCGDFQTSRNEEDLRCMAVPPKYYNICSFYKYYSGEKVAPILTILIGGNHEASNYLQELPYGGWVAPKIYYLGYAGVVNIAGVRIAGLSGIYKDRDYSKGHFEICPYNENTKRSVYHVRNLEVFRLKQIMKPIDIFLSHDWPVDVTDYGNKEQLLRFKPYFRDDITSRNLGSEPCSELLHHLKPNYWFSAHLHCKFSALIPHDDDKSTKFLALDKCLPRRQFLQILDIPHKEDDDLSLKYDLEWLTILVLTNHLLNFKPISKSMPVSSDNQRNNFTPNEEEKTLILNKLKNNLKIPENFIKTAPVYNKNDASTKNFEQPGPVQNQQTVNLCNLLNIDDPIELILNSNGESFEEYLIDEDLNETFINDTIEDTSSVNSKISLKLPEPINKSSNDLFIIDRSPHKNRSKRLSNDDEINIKEVKEENVGNGKKFKRRNADIYGHETNE